ncbi:MULTISPECIES: actinorhodin polyketide dimerase ActVA [Streptomyces]|uniref:Actinorhodin polyketide dimerase ActVA n=1 Tax=Streptomyces rubrogriseus TaxID=194673 RepID=A0ABT4NVT4_9ACTN|nr:MULTISPECIES: actinorhodin polyketide dimerase ActVA [Streptomyces]MBQ0948269.1 actinorhodin polyketide dimerase ActVA [Streptomyces sp. RK76]MCW8119849.1 actinorhodin polyketide dimerase ActVA [Streptomyces anthocyanicus]MCZ4633229.1 actinorhodin polyketide dimerase ActVA [Streptomyces rubrogriseus]
MSEDTMTQERPSLTAHARRIAELAGKRAADAEQQRRLSPDVVDSVLRAGFAAHFVPVAHGGRAATFGELVEPVAVLGEACASTAWYASLTASLGRMAAYLPDEGQAELWSDGPDALIVGALMPLGRAEKTPGGWHVSGTWPFVSVVDHSDWALICAKVGEEPWFFAVPRQEYGIVDSWYPMGMRGTGSNTLVLDGVFVPDARACTRAAIAAGLGPDAEAICHTVPMRAVNGLAFALPMLGAARGAAAVWTSWTAGKLAGPTGQNAVSSQDRVVYEHTLARATGEIDAAQLLLERVAAVADAGSATGVLVGRGARDCALAAELLTAATDRLFASAGTRAQAQDSPMQRLWRDVHAAGSHIGLQFGPGAALYAGELLRRSNDG